MRVGASIISVKKSEAKYLPKIISMSVTGRVLSISKEPLLYSSEKSLMETAGTLKARIIGNKLKKFLISALPDRKKVEKKNHPIIIRKSVIIIYAPGEVKKVLNSLL